MHGAIAGSFIGSRYAEKNVKSKSFSLFGDASSYTYVSYMTSAVTDALIKVCSRGVTEQERKTKRVLKKCLRRWRRRQLESQGDRGLAQWLKIWFSSISKSFCLFPASCTAAMASTAGWFFSDIDTTRKVARWTAEITHDQQETVRGAEAMASAVFLARTGYSKHEICHYISKAFGYDLTRTCDEIRPDYSFDDTCPGSVPEAVIAFLEGHNCLDAIRNAVSLGGDSDTIAAMAGAIAEAYYGTEPEWMLFKEAERKLPDEIWQVMHQFDEFKSARLAEMEMIKRYDISKARASLMTEEDRQIVDAYIEGESILQIEEKTGKTQQAILRVLHKAQTFDAFVRNIGRDMSPGLVWYINSMITKSRESTLWLRQLEEPRKLFIPCAFKFEEPEFLVLGIMSYAEKLPADAAEYSRLTGYIERKPRRIQSALNRVRMQIGLGRGRRMLLDSINEEGDTDD